MPTCLGLTVVLVERCGQHGYVGVKEEACREVNMISGEHRRRPPLKRPSAGIGLQR
jgi:hypothetical protein